MPLLPRTSTFVGISCCSNMRRVGTWKLAAEMPHSKKLLAQAEFEQCKRKLAKAAETTVCISGRTSPHKRGHVMPWTIHASCRCELQMSLPNFLATLDCTFSRLVHFFLAFFSKRINKVQLYYAVTYIPPKHMAELLESSVGLLKGSAMPHCRHLLHEEVTNGQHLWNTQMKSKLYEHMPHLTCLCYLQRGSKCNKIHGVGVAGNRRAPHWVLPPMS